MADPKLVTTAASISYRADDGYSSQESFKTEPGSPPHAALLHAHAESARLLALFGFEQEAREAAEARFKAVQLWRAEREASNG